MKRAIFSRSDGQCEYRASHSSMRCSSKARLQIDHVIPLSVGGKTELKNLRHLCPAHNQKTAQIAGLFFQVTESSHPPSLLTQYLGRNPER